MDSMAYMNEMGRLGWDFAGLDRDYVSSWVEHDEEVNPGVIDLVSSVSDKVDVPAFSVSVSAGCATDAEEALASALKGALAQAFARDDAKARAAVKAAA